MDPFAIDGHKLNYHIDRLAQWKEGASDWEKAQHIYPIYLEVSPVGACNHRCTFCAVDYLGYKALTLDEGMLKERLSEMGELGIRSIMYAGEGEPLLHKKMADLTCHTKASGIDASFTTNGVLLTKKFCDQALDSTSWIKVSLNAGDRETYSKVHRTKAEDFDRVIENLKRAVEIRANQKSKCTLGAQMVLLPENSHSAENFVKNGKDIGLDYVVIKPYSQHQSSITRTYENIDYTEMVQLQEKLKSYESKDFSVIFRINAMSRHIEGEREYQMCHATPYFWGYIMATGDVYGCSAFLGNDDFKYGNINEENFKTIWTSHQRQCNHHQMRNGFDLSNCRLNCRMEAVNRYLDAIENPPAHVNFI